MNKADTKTQLIRRCILPLALLALTGCGTLKSQQATEQLLMSDAVDRSIAKLDFRALAGRKVYLDTQYIRTIKGAGFVNADYIVSSVRQQMMADRCLLQDRPDAAEIIVEARVGALGADAHDVTYGLPASNALNTAASLVPNVPPLPSIPEISLGKKSDQRGAAKIALFAYDRETREPLWQSGTSLAGSDAVDVWVFGAGPFQRGTIYDRAKFAGSELQIPLLETSERDEETRLATFSSERTFAAQAALSDATDPSPETAQQAEVRLADYQQETKEEEKPPPPPKKLTPPKSAPKKETRGPVVDVQPTANRETPAPSPDSLPKATDPQ